MILDDTSFIIATISEDDRDHHRCMEFAATLREPLITTWPCVTEAMRLLHESPAQEKLRRQIEIGVLQVYSPTREDILRAFALMRKHADAPMDFADASLVAAAEVLGITRIVTLDRHFHAYRINDKTAFVALP